MKTTIIIPTINESKNLEILIPKIEKVLKKDIDVLIVDSNSSDNTKDVVKKFRKEYRNISILTCKKKGLGNAYVSGIKHCIKKASSNVIIQMDADLSHPPELLPLMIAKIKEGNDVCIASRYVEKGGTPDWSKRRKFTSKLGNLYIRHTADLKKIMDCTSGYRAIRLEKLKKISLEKLHLRGYAFQVNLLYELNKNNSRFSEIPLIFQDRIHGKSKLGMTDIIEFFIVGARIFLKRMMG